ncbi:MAG: transglutaminase domain-containing protein [Rhizobiales bacterium]|nr:transglutaminase domain-containing protein [Hyphomicrobiales bacterium]
MFEIEAGHRERALARVLAALEDWIRLGLGYQVSNQGERLFDPVEVINRMKWAGYRGLDDFWADHFVATTRAFVREWDKVSREPTSVNRVPERFSVGFRRRFHLDGITAGQKLRLRLPLPLSQSSEDIVIEPMVAPELSARIVQSEGRLDFQFAAPAEPAVEIAAKMTFTTSGYSCDVLAEDGVDIYLRGSDGLVRITPRIQALAKNLAGIDCNPLTAATTLFNHIIDDLMCGLVHYDQVDMEAPGDWVLENGWYDCQLGSALFVSLCRAHGIPARILSGHMLYRLAPGFHYWAEIWIDGKGWTPFDFLTWDLSKAGHDASWRNFFAGAIDYRMTTQCFPLMFTGPMSIRFPTAWHLVNAPSRGGMDVRFAGLDGRLIYCDSVSARSIAR